MQLKTAFTFNRQRALQIRRLAEAYAKEHGIAVSTQATMDALVDRAYEMMRHEQQAPYARQP